MRRAVLELAQKGNTRLAYWLMCAQRTALAALCLQERAAHPGE